MWLGTRNDVTLRRVGQQAQKFLGIQPNRLGEMFELVREQLPVAEELFQMELYDAAQLQDITDAARETLMVHNLRQIDMNKDLEKTKQQLEEENSELKTENVRDPLTNAHNRRYFEESQEVMGWIVLGAFGLALAAYLWRVLTWKPRSER